MRDKQSASPDVLPDNFETLEEIWAFWDTHSTADCEDAMEAMEVEVEPSSSSVAGVIIARRLP